MNQNKWITQTIPDPHFTRCRGCHRLICLLQTSMLHSHNTSDEDGYKWHFVMCKIKYRTNAAERLRLNKYI